MASWTFLRCVKRGFGVYYQLLLYSVQKTWELNGALCYITFIPWCGSIWQTILRLSSDLNGAKKKVHRSNFSNIRWAETKKKDEAVCLLHTLADAPVGVFSYLAHRKKSLKTALWQQPKEHPGFELIKKSKRFFCIWKNTF